MRAAPRKWTRALLRRTLEDETLFDELRRTFRDGTTEAQIRARIHYELSGNFTPRESRTFAPTAIGPWMR